MSCSRQRNTVLADMSGTPYLRDGECAGELMIVNLMVKTRNSGEGKMRKLRSFLFSSLTPVSGIKHHDYTIIVSKSFCFALQGHIPQTARGNEIFHKLFNESLKCQPLRACGRNFVFPRRSSTALLMIFFAAGGLAQGKLYSSRHLPHRCTLK